MNFCCHHESLPCDRFYQEISEIYLSLSLAPTSACVCRFVCLAEQVKICLARLNELDKLYRSRANELPTTHAMLEQQQQEQQ